MFCLGFQKQTTTAKMGTGQRRGLSGVECWNSDEAVAPGDPRADHPSHDDKVSTPLREYTSAIPSLPSEEG